MQTIIHKIRLKPGCTGDVFERWVREVDYAAAEQLPSVLAFAVHRCTDAEASGAGYFEVITVSDMAAFNVDMKTSLFASLVQAFDSMATVVDEIGGPVVGDGYTESLHRSHEPGDSEVEQRES